MTIGNVPNGLNQFFDANGDPVSLGFVGMYIPGTETAKDTWADSDQLALNENPIELDAGGYASIYGVGSYRQIVLDANNNLIWDQVVTVGGGGSAAGGAFVDLASAATTSIAGAGSEKVRITGTVTITSFGVADAGTQIELRFASSGLVLTHNASSLILPGGANITTVANDYALAVSLGSSNWVVLDYMAQHTQTLANAFLAAANGSVFYKAGGVWTTTTPGSLPGLGTMAVQNANAVAITGGSITGITDLAIADGGTGASTAADARTNLGLGTAATQNTGTSGANLPFLNGTNLWGGTQSFGDTNFNLALAGSNPVITLDSGSDNLTYVRSTNVLQFNIAASIQTFFSAAETEINSTLFDVNANLDVSGTTVFGSTISIPNNVGILLKESGGTDRTCLKMNSSNVVEHGNASNASTYLGTSNTFNANVTITNTAPALNMIDSNAANVGAVTSTWLTVNDQSSNAAARVIQSSGDAFFDNIAGGDLIIRLGVGATTAARFFASGTTLTVTGAITGGSDRKLKSNIKDLELAEAINFVRSLRPRSFLKHGKEQLGFVAQEVEDPRFVFTGGEFLSLPAGAEWIAPVVKVLQHLLEK